MALLGHGRNPTAFQPLRRIDDPVERAWAARFVLDLLVAQRLDETPDIKHDVDQALALAARAVSREPWSDRQSPPREHLR